MYLLGLFVYFYDYYLLDTLNPSRIEKYHATLFQQKTKLILILHCNGLLKRARDKNNLTRYTYALPFHKYIIVYLTNKLTTYL